MPTDIDSTHGGFRDPHAICAENLDLLTNNPNVFEYTFYLTWKAGSSYPLKYPIRHIMVLLSDDTLQNFY